MLGSRYEDRKKDECGRDKNVKIIRHYIEIIQRQDVKDRKKVQTSQSDIQPFSGLPLSSSENARMSGKISYKFFLFGNKMNNIQYYRTIPKFQRLNSGYGRNT